MRFPVGGDIAERVGATFAEGAIGVALADQFGIIELANAEWWHAVVTGGVVAVLALGKSALATWLNKRKGQQGGSLHPAVSLAPASSGTARD
jgi:hypothetical protein